MCPQRRGGNEAGWRRSASTLRPMHIDVTEPAQALLAKKGGTITIDVIKPVG